ncbi:MAG: lasso peptide biosynthesis B2 protein [bacterium]|nr:lasso peptide biosynthesis B2 protein [bacterium]
MPAPPSQPRVWRWLKRSTGTVTALAALCLVHGLLAVMRYRQVCQLLIRLSPRPDGTRTEQRRSVRALAGAVNAAADGFGFNCLRRSLVLWWFLRWRNLESVLRFGVNRDTAHVWVEYQGEVVNDVPDIAARYAITYTEPLAPDTITRMPIR